MKTIGLIGGMSWESTTEYYKVINTTIKEKLGGLSSAKIILYSVNFQEIEVLQRDQNWEQAGKILANAAVALEKAGCDFILICTNTMHKVAGVIQSAINIPVLHIAEPVIHNLKELEIQKVLLLGTQYTMEQDFYKEKYLENNIEIIVPDSLGIQLVNDIIYNELCVGIFSSQSENKIINLIKEVKQKYNIGGVILGCTELELLIKQENIDIPIFKTAELHAEFAAELSVK